MESRISRSLLRILTAFALVSCFAFWAAAEDDSDPNSPTPILLSEVDSTRALAQTTNNAGKVSLSKIVSQAFSPGSKVVLYVTNLDLMENEGANAFRVFAEDKSGHVYRFPVLDLQPSPNAVDLYAVTILLKDEIRYWGPPADGDVHIYLTWRGLASNTVKLGIGQTGGLKDATGAKPTPLGTTANKAASKGSDQGMSPGYVGYRWSGDRMRFLEQAAFGPTAALDSRIRRIGLRTWLAEQFEAPYPSLSNPYPNHILKPANIQPDCDGEQTITPDVPVTCFRDSYTMYPTQQWFMKETFYGDAQLKHRVAWALSQIWVTSGVDVQQSRHMVEYHKILSANAFGNFRNLMEQMTLNPAMGGYLDMAISTRTNPNENYARELMQLFTIGLFLLNQDGTLKLDGSNNPIPTYDQNGVNNLTRVLTGWTFCNPGLDTCPNSVQGTQDYIDPMIVTFPNNNVVNNRHDLTAKTLLTWPADPNFPPNNTNVPACAVNCNTIPGIRAYADTSLDQALDNIFHHPNVGPFISKILIQHLVTSDPTQAYVGRVAAVFHNNGLGTKGDMKAVVRAILLDPEARGDTKTDPNYGKLREPVQLATNFLRAMNVRSANGLSQSDGVIFQRGEFTGMGQVPFRSPTVFNYYPPDYGIPGTTLLGPEFALLTTGTSIQRTNFVNRFVFTAIPVPVSTDAPNGTSLDFSDLQALSAADATGNLLVDELNRRMMHSTMTTAMKNSILTAVTSVASTDTLGRVRQAVYLVTTSTQYQVQR